jgi:hypothetical protein
MSKPLGYAYIKEGEGSLNLEPSDLFDKIINLKLIRKKGRPIIIRSDYEPVFHDSGGLGGVSFKRCVQKPEIKISYKQAAQSVVIEVDIRITNLFLDGIDESAESMFTADGNPVISCVVQMGYRKQFIDYTSPAHEEDVNGFYSFDVPDSGSLWRQINIEILTGYRESYPPDSVTYFKGVIGTMASGLRWTHTEADLKRGYGDDRFPEEFGDIESVLYQFVTRRFIRSGVQHITELIQDFTNTNVVQESQDPLAEPSIRTIKQKVHILGYAKYKNPGNGAMERLEASKAMTNYSPTLDDIAEMPLLENGVMPIADANKFGVICACSNTLRSLRAPALFKYGLSPERAAKIGTVSPAPFDDMVDSLGGQLSAIQQHYPFLRWFILTDGSFYFYHERDTEADLWLDDYINYMRQKNVVPLPAIYDMTPSGTRTIRCPFISFLNPMTTVMFQSRYDLGTLTSFYYPVKTHAFLVIMASITFSTTGDDNMMELMCVDVPPKEALKTAPDGSFLPPEHTPMETPEVAKMQDARNALRWERVELTVVPHKTGALDTDSSWSNIVKNEITERLDKANFPELAVYSEKQALEFLKAANPEYFDPDEKYMKRNDSIYGESTENSGYIAEGTPNPQAAGIGGRTGIKVCWLKSGEDKIVLRDPVRPSFDNEEYYPPDMEING